MRSLQAQNCMCRQSTTKIGKSDAHEVLRTCGPSRPTRPDFRAVPLSAAHVILLCFCIAKKAQLGELCFSCLLHFVRGAPSAGRHLYACPFPSRHLPAFTAMPRSRPIPPDPPPDGNGRTPPGGRPGHHLRQFLRRGKADGLQAFEAPEEGCPPGLPHTGNLV